MINAFAHRVVPNALGAAGVVLAGRQVGGRAMAVGGSAEAIHMCARRVVSRAHFVGSTKLTAKWSAIRCGNSTLVGNPAFDGLPGGDIGGGAG